MFEFSTSTPGHVPQTFPYPFTLSVLNIAETVQEVEETQELLSLPLYKYKLMMHLVQEIALPGFLTLLLVQDDAH